MHKMDNSTMHSLTKVFVKITPFTQTTECEPFGDYKGFYNVAYVFLMENVFDPYSWLHV